jgi:alkylation response protein AidB-like acyl-CoA dehydrogenase
VRFTPTADQQLFAKTVRDLLERECSPEALRAAWDSGTGRVPRLWGRLAELGLTALTVPESHGGLGLTAAEIAPLLEETGRVAMPEPLVETLVAADLLARAGGPVADEWLPRVADGSAVVAVGLGPGGYVSGAEHADLLLLARAGEVHAMRRESVRLDPQPTVDRGVRLARVQWQPTDGVPLAGANADAGFDLAAVLVAAQLLGLARAMLDMAVRYARQREQFGRPIGSFQALKHLLADAYVAAAFTDPVVTRAAWSVAHDLPGRARDASHAKHAATEAAQRAARTALQVHGGIGYTFEHDLHMWLKRTWTLASLGGDAAWHRARVADAVLGGNPPRVP